VMVASNCASATEILERLPIDLAVLDVNLGKETSIGIADELAEQDIPFVFATDYSDSLMIPDRHAVVPVIRKPCQSVDLVKALAHARELGQSTNQ
jgi:CheY-like chemotaxis protein